MKYYFGQKSLDLSCFNYNLSGFGKCEALQDCIGRSEVFIKLLWIKKEKIEVVFISLDILYVPLDLSKKIYDYLKEKYNIEKQSIIFNATHTHSAPGIEKKFDKFIDEKISRKK